MLGKAGPGHTSLLTKEAVPKIEDTEIGDGLPVVTHDEPLGEEWWPTMDIFWEGGSIMDGGCEPPEHLINKKYILAAATEVVATEEPEVAQLSRDASVVGTSDPDPASEGAWGAGPFLLRCKCEGFV